MACLHNLFAVEMNLGTPPTQRGPNTDINNTHIKAVQEKVNREDGGRERIEM